MMNGCGKGPTHLILILAISYWNLIVFCTYIKQLVALFPLYQAHLKAYTISVYGASDYNLHYEMFIKDSFRIVLAYHRYMSQYQICEAEGEMYLTT